MEIATIIASGAYSLSALGFLGFAVTFGLRKEWEPWHADAAQRPWSRVEPSMQLVILAIMRAAAAGGLALALITAALVWQFVHGDPFARWALPVVTLTFAIPGAAVAFRFGAQTKAAPPLGPAVAGVVVPLIGVVATLV